MTNPNPNKDIWLKVLLGVIVSILFLLCTLGAAAVDKMDEKKVDKVVFDQHQQYQNEQFSLIRGSLQRLEDK